MDNKLIKVTLVTVLSGQIEQEIFIATAKMNRMDLIVAVKMCKAAIKVQFTRSACYLCVFTLLE